MAAMSREIPLSLYPVSIVQDRYQGCYSRGDWLAVANADERPIFDSGPYGDDVEAAAFWSNPPDWIRAGASPDEAVANLLAAKGFG